MMMMTVDSRALEMDNIETLAKAALNRFKAVKIDGKRKQPACLSAHRRYETLVVHLPSIYIFGVTISSRLSVSDHNLISKCSGTLYALTILRAHGLCDVVLQSVYMSVIIARLLYASCAWW